MKAIDLIQQKCKEIININYKDDKRKPHIIISEMYKKGYIITIIFKEDEMMYNERQSEFITLDTDLEEVLELLYIHKIFLNFT